ncbi:hypothetical protein [Rhizobium binxianense]
MGSMETISRTTRESDYEKTLLTSVVNDVYAASATTSSKIGGGTLFPEATRSPQDVERDMNDWYPQLGNTITRLRSADPAPRMVSQVGPLDTGPIHFDGGVPVRGFAQLTLHQSGHFNFVGHFHDSGATSYNVAFAVGVRSQLGVLYTFASSGHMAGTFEFGSRDFDWSISEHRPILHEDWANIAVNSTWWWSAKVNLDIFGVLDTVKTLAQVAGAVGSVVALV